MNEEWALPIMTEKSTMGGLLPLDVWVEPGHEDEASIIAHIPTPIDQYTSHVCFIDKDGAWDAMLPSMLTATVSPAVNVQEWS
jgi:hypothetical protein